MVYKTTFKSL